MYKFELGECEIIWPNGQARVVNTLEHALQQCDTTAAAGITGIGFDFLARMDPATVRPLLRVWLRALGLQPLVRRFIAEGVATRDGWGVRV